MEKVIIFGTGKRAQWIFKYLDKYNEFEVVEIWDNNEKKTGKIYEVNGKNVVVKQPHYENQYNIIVSSDVYYEEITRQLIENLSINPIYIKKFGYVFNSFKAKILEKYKDSDNAGINNICKYLRANELDVFCGQISNNYPLDIFEVHKDSDNGLLYSFWQGKKIYLSSVYKNPNDAKAYLCTLCKEQDVNSPHCYNIDKLDFYNTDIFIDGGAAEGFLALQVIDMVKHVYLVECDKEWVEALKLTFEPYKDKVTIIEKWLDEADSENTVSIDTLVLNNKNMDKIIVKMDIEGKETDVIKGMEKLIDSDIDMTCIICTYHKSGDEDIIHDFFEQRGFDITFANGYMFFPYGEIIEPELRKAVLTARKIIKN